MASKTKRTSMKGRLDRLQAEAAATETEKKEKKAAKKSAKKTVKKTRKSSKASAASARMRYVWQVHVKGDLVAQFDWAQRSEAASEAARLSKESRSEHEVVKAKVPMDD